MAVIVAPSSKVVVATTPPRPISVEAPPSRPINVVVGPMGPAGPPGPPGPEGGTPVVAVPYNEWPPVAPHPNTLYLRLAP
jgi:hypothetical protein